MVSWSPAEARRRPRIRLAGRPRRPGVPRLPAAVTDWPSGPGTIHGVGTITAGSVWCTTSRAQICVMMIIEANKLAAELSAATLRAVTMTDLDMNRTLLAVAGGP